MFTNYHNNRRIILVFLCIITVFIMIFAYEDQKENRHIIQTEPIALTDNWNITYNGYTSSSESLPTRVDVSPATPITLSTYLPEVDNTKDALLIRSSMQDIKVTLDGRTIYTYENVDNGTFDSPYISTWLLVRLPADFQGKHLEITISSPTEDFAGTINLVQLGSPDALVMSVLSSQYIALAIFFLLFVTGITLIIINMTIRNIRDNRLFYLGFFAVSTGIWTISEARVLSLFCGNRFILGSISYLMIFMMAASLGLYIKEAIIKRPKFKAYLRLLSGVFFIGLISITLLQVFSLKTFIESMDYSLVIIVASILFVSYMFYIEHHIDHNPDVMPMVKYSLILITSILIESVIFYTGYFDFTSHVFRTGILIFFSFLIYDTLKALRNNINSQQKQALLEVLAYQDSLIQGNNRTRFEHDIQALVQAKKDYRLIIIDLNDLKIINDQMGHTSGDQALQQVYHTLDDVAKDYGKAYRIGGDEFAIISENQDDQTYNSKCKLLFDHINDHELPFSISIAIGSDNYHPEEWRQFSEFYHHVDQLMYLHKLQLKAKIVD